MSLLAYRTNTLFDNSTGRLQPAGGWHVTALKPGGIASASSSGATLTLYAGHGFSAGDKFYVFGSATFSGLYTVSSTSSTSITMTGGSYSVSAGDVILNLSGDTGVATPNWDGNGVTIYSDPAGTVSVPNATVTSGSDGGDYAYWYGSSTSTLPIWECIRNTSGVVSSFSVFTGGITNVFGGPNSTTIIGDSPLASGLFQSGININKSSTSTTPHGLSLSRDGHIRWALGEDFQAGDRSYLAIWSDRANFGGTIPGTLTSSDLLSILPAASDSNAQDGPKWKFNSGFGSFPDNGSFQYEFNCPTNQSSGTGIYNSWFGNSNTAIPSGGIYVLASGGRPGVTLIQNGTAGGGRKAYIAAGKGGATGYNFGVDLPAADTQSFSIFDNAASAYVFHIDASGKVGVGPGNTAPSHFLDVGYSQNAATRCQVSNQTSGAASRAGFTAASGSVTINVDINSATFASDPSDGHVYTSGTGAMLHLGTGGTKRVTIHDSAAKVGIGVDPPTNTLSINGDIQVTKFPVAITGNDDIATAGRSYIALTNNTGTNTITIHAPSSEDGKILVLQCVALTSGTFTVADSGNCKLSAAWTPDADDTLTLIANGVLWYELARSAN